MVVDVGGGDGALLAELLTENPSLTGILFDQPHVIAGAEQVLADEPSRRRIRLAGGDMFHAVPSGATVYLLKSVLHDWPDEDCQSILQICREAMTPSSVILIIERLLDAPTRAQTPSSQTSTCLSCPAAENAPRPNSRCCYWVLDCDTVEP